MQIQRIKTLNEIDGIGSHVITKDYFEANPVFYYCYRIFPFERGHGIFVANSIRRFLLYEIPTIAITSVLIRTLKENSHTENLQQFTKEKISDEQAGKLSAETNSSVGFENPVSNNAGMQTSQMSLSASFEENRVDGTIRPADLNEPTGPSVELAATPSFLKGNLSKSSAAQLKKKKVTKKALKEQAAELFSYTSDPFAETIDATNIHDADFMSSHLEKNNQQSDQEVSSLTEFTTIPFVRESFLEILLNLKACVFENSFAFDESSIDGKASEVLKGKLILNASEESLADPTEVSQELFFQTDFDLKESKVVRSISFPSEKGNATQIVGEVGKEEKKVFPQGRRVREYKIWAKDLILPPGLKVKNPDLVLATLVAPRTNCELELSFEKIFQPDLTTLSMKTGRAPHRAEQQRRNVPIDGTLFPIKKVNFALSYTKFQKEVVTFEIWTNGAVNPRAAIFQCVEKILTLFQNLRESQVKEIDSFAETAADEFE